MKNFYDSLCVNCSYSKTDVEKLMTKVVNNIGRALFIEFSEGDSSVLDEIMEVLERHPEFEFLWLKHEPVMSLPGLEINPAHRKVCCDHGKLTLRQKNMTFFACLQQIRGESLPMTIYIRTYGWYIY